MLMPRPFKKRRVCYAPSQMAIGPVETPRDLSSTVFMTVDELETLRLMDIEGLTQEECAKRMDIARTTAQAIYASARRKAAECIVNGNSLLVGGGEYRLCNGDEGCCGKNCIRNSDFKENSIENTLRMRKADNMKIAICYENGSIFQHFGHTEQFAVYAVKDGEAKLEKIVDTNGSGHGALAEFLRELGVEALVCGGIGRGAKIALAEAEIALYPGCLGSADAAAKALAEGKLEYNLDTECNHHHEGGHDCGQHGEDHACGGHCGR